MKKIDRCQKQSASSPMDVTNGANTDWSQDRLHLPHCHCYIIGMVGSFICDIHEHPLKPMASNAPKTNLGTN